ncbi:uncharacterized protein [Nicotiana tomentosiformis]|uniref:uncharacterized protein n=1 Tax=Nicotiana tomentosiformis TaxID=4098 RepID=UPI00388CC9BE
MNTVSLDFLSGIIYASNAHLICKDLHGHFDKVNRVRIFQLHREIATISQGTDSVAAYFTKLKELWAEYDTLVPSPGCDCPKSRDYIEYLYRQRLLQFLSGLNESYEQTRRQILMKTIKPSLNQAYAMIIEDESQRSNPFPALAKKVDPLAMQGKKKYAVNNMTRNAEFDTRPEGMEGGNNSEPPKFGSYFIEDQYKQILGMLNKETTNPQANMSGITTCLMAYVCSGEWIIDSGASHYITADLNMLRTVTIQNSHLRDRDGA